MPDQELASMFKALGDPTRLRIYAFLADCACPVAVEDSGEVRPSTGPTVGDICCHITGIDQSSPNISFHLKELRNAGLVSAEKRGKNILYAANSAAQETLLAFFAAMRKDRPDCCS